MLEGNFKIPTLGATCLDLEVELNCHIPVLTSFLKSSPCLETLIIKICSKYERSGTLIGILWINLHYGIWSLLYPTCRLIVLAYVHDFLESQSQWFYKEADQSLYMNKFLKNCFEVKLLKILLKCCKTLNRITIHTSKECLVEPLFFRGLKEKLLALLRGSENVIIDIS